jgi:lysophospholipase L1-like esterase
VIVDPRLGPLIPHRPEIQVAQPTAGVVHRPGAGATAVFLGDSYTSGWNGAGLGAQGWPALVDGAQGWRTINLAVAGTGFINPGWTHQPVSSGVSATIREKPDIVFIAAGHNDSRWSAAATSAAADQVIDSLHRSLPEATLVVIAPIWANGSPPTRCLVLRDHLRRKAASLGTIFIDPLAERWFAGNAHRLIGPDGIHPTDAGYSHIAGRVLADLDAAG